MPLEPNPFGVDHARSDRRLDRGHDTPERAPAGIVHVIDDVGLEKRVPAGGEHTGIRVAGRVGLAVQIVLLRQLLVDIGQGRVLFALLVTRGEVEHGLVLPPAVVTAVLDQQGARRPGDFLLLRIGIGQPPLGLETVIAGVPVRKLRDALSRIDPGTGITRPPVVHLGRIIREHADSALQGVHLDQPFLLGPFAECLHVHRRGQVDAPSVPGIEDQPILVADLIPLTVESEVDRSRRLGAPAVRRPGGGKPPQIPVVPHDDVRTIPGPSKQPARNRRLDLIVIVLGIPEFARAARGEVPGRRLREVVHLPVPGVVIGVAGIVRREGLRSGASKPSQPAPGHLALDQGAVAGGEVHRVEVAIREPLDSGIPLVARDVGPDSPGIARSPLKGADLVVGEPNQLPGREIE